MIPNPKHKPSKSVFVMHITSNDSFLCPLIVKIWDDIFEENQHIITGLGLELSFT